jgi:hypothetical protein
MKTSELVGALLDYWVARADGCENPRLATRSGYAPTHEDPIGCRVEGGLGFAFLPSTSWAQGGPIIERECITTVPPQCIGDWDQWRAFSRGDVGGETGDTLLIAAMRAYVVSKFGDTVPDAPA